MLIKTLILPQFNRLFLTILTPKSILDKINRLFFQCLWNGKPDKIRRSTLYKHNNLGGLQMLNVYCFEDALKLSWIRKLFDQQNSLSPWYKLLLSTTGNLENLTSIGQNWCLLLCQKIHNPFWKHVFTQWVSFCAKLKPKTTVDVLQNSLWYNGQISKETLFLKNWHSKGIKIVADLVDGQGQILTAEEISRQFGIQPNLFNYYRVRALLKKFLEKNIRENNFSLVRPHILSNVSILLKQKKGSRPFYIEGIKQVADSPPLFKGLWTRILKIEINDETWKQIFNACFYVVSDNYMKWFQYKILNNILGTNDYLFKLKLSNTNMCRMCHTDTETITHLFAECTHSIEFWENINYWLRNGLCPALHITKQMKILGYLERDSSFLPLNFIFLYVRRYIFSCAKNGHALNLYFFLNHLETKFEEEEMLAKIKCQQLIFDKNWKKLRVFLFRY